MKSTLVLIEKKNVSAFEEGVDAVKEALPLEVELTEKVEDGSRYYKVTCEYPVLFFLGYCYGQKRAIQIALKK